MNDPVRFEREVVCIEGGRKLYNYRFKINEDLSLNLETDNQGVEDNNVQMQL